MTRLKPITGLTLPWILTAVYWDRGISGPPGFVSPAWGITGDYHLKNNSPAIDMGTSLEAPDSDLDNNSRPQGNGFDLGAYEYLKE